MPDAVAILVLVAANLATGRLLLVQFRSASRALVGDRLGLVLVCFGLGVTTNGWLAFLLAEAGWFSLRSVGGAWLVLLVVLGWRARSRREPITDDGPIINQARARRLAYVPGGLEPVFLALWLGVACWLFFRPHEFVLGGADAGVYVNLSASIAKTGGIVLHDETLADLDPALYPALLRPIPPSESAAEVAPNYVLPGFFVPTAASGQVVPQFYHLHPVWQAVAYSLGGVRVALLLTGLWAVFAGLTVYELVRRLAGWEAAAIALTGLSVNALQAWFARYPTTEALTQYLLWTGLWALLVWLESQESESPSPINGRVWPLLAGLALGEVFLVRIDTYFLLAIPGLLWLEWRWRKRAGRALWWFTWPVLALTVHSVVHALWQSRPYFYNIFGYGLRLLEAYWPAALAAALGGVTFLVALFFFRAQVAAMAKWRQPLLLAGVIVLVLVALYGWFVRPNLGGEAVFREDWFGGAQLPRTLDRENLRRLAWYLSPLGVALAVAGSSLMLWRAARPTAPILLTGFIFALLYLWRIQANPHQIYAMRRYVPAVLPFAVIAAASLFGWLFHSKQRWQVTGGLLLALAWLGSLGWLARGFVSHIDYAGIINQLDELNEGLAPRSVLIFDDQAPVTVGDRLGTPLQFLYGHSVYSLRDPSALDAATMHRAIDGWQQAGRTVYWIGDVESLTGLGLPAGATTTYTIRAEELEGTYERKPTRVLQLTWALEMTMIQ